ncbi:hypothetical protein QAD02_014516 [Eretmocerus hayati]|uniref:Uncharacterized protein n=1 Tax=Eretmocerus hayati TaxID=131215 RepID=A0ACC2P573_9HYME|nr:hypothetical protein QAD02_014516 [Eretmocerus hayati]
MSEQFLGCTVSIKCIEDLGDYQGQIVAVDDNSVTLAKTFCNGIPHFPPQVTLRAKDILNIDIVSVDDPDSHKDVQLVSRFTVKRPIAKRAGRSVSECAVPVAQQQSSQTPQNVRKPPPEVQSYPDSSLPQQKLVLGQTRASRKKMTDRDEQAFGTPIDQSLNQEFDFEKNLALFNKQAIWQEINSKRPDVVQQSQNRGNNKGRYRHDENVLESEPTALRQILVPKPGSKEYVTDDGLIIPSITLDLQRQLIGAADRLGISWERRVELLGRAGTEIILQLLGGAHRLNPNNAHQCPTVVALAGPHRSGAAAVNCARQLTSHGVKTVVYVENSEDVFLLQELSLYKLTGHKVETDVRKLPAAADLIIVGLSEDQSPRVVNSNVIKWTNNNRASILAIDPPSTGTPGIVCKYSLLAGPLPLTHCMENGRLYLANLALPNKVFSDAGVVRYRSPFGPKFVIPLHLNSS